MPRRSSRNPGNASNAKKAKLEDAVHINEVKVRFEWEGDGDRWIQYSKVINQKIAQAYSDKKKQVEIEVAQGVMMVVVFGEMIQKNKRTGYQRRIRIALKTTEDNEYKVLEWQGDDKDWNPYSVPTSLDVVKSIGQGKTVLHTDPYTLNLDRMIQTNINTKTVRKMRLGKQDSEAAEQEEEVKEEEKEEEEVKQTKSNGASKKSTKAKSGNKKGESTVKTVVLKKGRAPVDPSCPIASKCCVYEHARTVWDCMLNQTNISNNNNKFYLIQLLKMDGKEEYHCWQRWGRVGYEGQNNLVHCGTDLNEAQKVFGKKFSDKTGNSWDNLDSFSKRPGKYDLIKMDYNTETKGDDNDNEKDEKESVEDSGDNKTVPDSKLDKRIQDLVNLICDIKSMEAEIIEMKYDTKKAPLGKLTKDQLKAGYTALKEIERLINEKLLGSELREACNNFYTRIPHEFGMQVPPLIRSPQDVKKKLQLLEALDDIEIAIKLLKGGDKSENPVDRHYHQLKCGLSPLDKISDSYKLLENYLQSTHASTHKMYTMELQEVFEMDKDGEVGRFKDCGNRMLLWHGSRLTNWAGILGQGLRIAPPEAPVTGYMFGKGVYFADMSSKSANYCFATKTRPLGVLVLCEVALGAVEEKLHADPKAASLPSGKHSVKGLGMVSPDEKTYVTMPDGLVVPVGKECKTSVQKSNKAFTLNYNEYIVYDTAQIKMKYLLLVKFKFR